VRRIAQWSPTGPPISLSSSLLSTLYPKAKYELEKTRDQYLVRTGEKGPGHSRNFKYGPQNAQYASKGEALKAAEEWVQKLKDGVF